MRKVLLVIFYVGAFCNLSFMDAQDINSKDINSKDINSKDMNSKDMNSKDNPPRFTSNTSSTQSDVDNTQNKMRKDSSVKQDVKQDVKQGLAQNNSEQDKEQSTEKSARQTLPGVMYSIQVGSFKDFENAGDLSESLNQKGLDAFFFKDKDLYKVRFGNYKSKEDARQEALRLKQQDIIDDFYIVGPDAYLINNTESSSVNATKSEKKQESKTEDSNKTSGVRDFATESSEGQTSSKERKIQRESKQDGGSAKIPANTKTKPDSQNTESNEEKSEQTPQKQSNNIKSNVRDSIVKDAHKYIGVPYKWGGMDSGGFDCSGLARAVYKLNGLELPRMSKEQYQSGSFVSKNDMKKGDLIFFITDNGKNINHVGIYIGENQFIHAPGKGKKVQIESLQTSYWKKTYKGAKSYL